MRFWITVLLIFLLVLPLTACGSANKDENKQVIMLEGRSGDWEASLRSTYVTTTTPDKGTLYQSLTIRYIGKEPLVQKFSFAYQDTVDKISQNDVQTLPSGVYQVQSQKENTVAPWDFAKWGRNQANLTIQFQGQEIALTMIATGRQ
ncbi:hypothetical protein [Brevibacillus sp. SYSU BS000544]|uniref:hypothetical protein n=1 Tax=Brevibacillus sp. SYSU BS000544 TaxID=3416443 RepID=UPI003CE4828E